MIRTKPPGYHLTIEQKYIVEDRGFSSPCWVWQYGVNDTGYTIVMVDKKRYLTHRYFYENHHGPIPDGLEIDHLCRVRSCVNPAHLEAVTPRENTRRSNVATLTEQNATDIRRRCQAAFDADPITVRGTPRRRIPSAVKQSLAQEYGVSLETIWRVWAGRTWA